MPTKAFKRLILVAQNSHELAVATEALAKDYVVSVAVNINEALKLVKDVRPVGILIDWESFASRDEVQTFVDACKNFMHDICFIIVAPECGAAEKAQSVGLNYFLPKPFDHLTVSVTVNACIG